jgi:hypothetical protein
LEYVALPDWKIKRLKAKVDTGAQTSSLHVDEIVRLKGGRVRFYVVLGRKVSARRKKVVCPVVRRGGVRSSNGIGSRRVFVRTRVRIGSIEREIELNLVDRQRMTYRMLLGRTALGGFRIDVDQAHLLNRPPRPGKSG